LLERENVPSVKLASRLPLRERKLRRAFALPHLLALDEARRIAANVKPTS
jgi:hypothetical protein